MLRPSDTRSNSFFSGLKAFGIPLLLGDRIGKLCTGNS
jgi:hypothetical protein